MLHVCAQNNLKKMASLCLQHGCDINAVNRKGMTPLDVCDKLNFSGLAQWFVTMGAENRLFEGHGDSGYLSNARSIR